MAFNVSTCLTNLGNRTITGPIDIYVNSNLNTPIQTVALSQITPPNCPLSVSVPDGTTSIRLTDRPTGCSLTMPIQNNNLCPTCDFDFSQVTNNKVGLISVGNLTAACETNITDYKVNWYGPGVGSNNLVFTSGFGNQFQYQYPHPLTGNAQLPAQEGVYTPKLVNVVLNGVSFSQTGGTGNVLANIDCIGTITVDPYRCDNSTNTDTFYPFNFYNHKISFRANSQQEPQPVSFTYVISANTKFLALSFRAYQEADRLTLSLSGAGYPNGVIGLEDWVVGSSVQLNDFRPSTIPKSAQTADFFNKIVCLTGLTINNNDRIIVSITPSIRNTDWDFYFTCLNNYNCTNCFDTNLFKIIGNTITATTTTCGENTIQFSISGCTPQQTSDDYSKYYVTFNNSAPYFGPYRQNIQSQQIFNRLQLYFPTTRCDLGGSFYNIPTCKEDVNQPTIYEISKQNNLNVYAFTGSANFISSIYNSWKSKVDTYWTNPPSSSIDFYRTFYILIPSNDHPGNCGDPPNQFGYYQIHPSANFSSGTTQGKFFMRITGKTISKNITFTECELNCENNAQQIVNGINFSATADSYTRRVEFSPSGVYYDNSTVFDSKLNITNGVSLTAQTLSGYHRFFQFESNTYPFSGVNKTLIPSLSGTVCNYNTRRGETFFGPNGENGGVTVWKYFYQVRLPNQVRPQDFEIWTSPIVNGAWQGYPTIFNPLYNTLVYRFSGGSVTFSSSTYII